MQARRVESGQPHVAHQHQPKRVGRVTEPARQNFAARLVANMRLPVWRVGCGTGYDDLDPALAVLVVVPTGEQREQLAVEIDAYAAAHADDHRLAVQGLKAAFKVIDDIPGHELQPLLGADNRFELRPLGLELLLSLDFFALSRLLEAGVDLGLLPFVDG